jgi:hypothetical protein
MAADTESLITLAASILLANQVHTPHAEAQRGRIRTAVDTAKQIHTEVKRVLAARAGTHKNSNGLYLLAPWKSPPKVICPERER